MEVWEYIRHWHGVNYWFRRGTILHTSWYIIVLNLKVTINDNIKKSILNDTKFKSNCVI